MWGVVDVSDEGWGVTDNCVFHVKTQLDKVKVAQSCLTLRDPMDIQSIFPTQGSNPGLLHCKWILYQLSHKGSPQLDKDPG